MREGESRQTRMGGGGQEKVEKRQSGKETERTQSPRLGNGATFYCKMRSTLQARDYQFTRVHITRAHLQTRGAKARCYHVQGEPAVFLALINNIYLIPATQNGGGGGGGGGKGGSGDCGRTERYIINGCKNEEEQSGERKQISSGRFVIETHVEDCSRLGTAATSRPRTSGASKPCRYPEHTVYGSRTDPHLQPSRCPPPPRGHLYVCE